MTTSVLAAAIGIAFVWAVCAVATAITEEEPKVQPRLTLIQGGKR